MFTSGPGLGAGGGRSGRRPRAAAPIGRTLAGLLVAAATAWAGFSGIPAEGRDRSPPAQASSLGTVALGELPPEARHTHRLVRSGGPFPYDKDGSVFGNRERLLPERPRGHYREYTVPTPRSRDRGARRLVCGGQPPTAPEACFYTDDHYASFRLVAQ